VPELLQDMCEMWLQGRPEDRWRQRLGVRLNPFPARTNIRLSQWALECDRPHVLIAASFMGAQW
jgi:hypothetical protein